ncbi:hypothetical protein QVD99_000060 [Batrachochytrium dendrobatidis]|nr:hypothetical protein QVD99_000060 [Batrachochytrium dendrobatidis]
MITSYKVSKQDRSIAMRAGPKLRKELEKDKNGYYYYHLNKVEEGYPQMINQVIRPPKVFYSLYLYIEKTKFIYGPPRRLGLVWAPMNRFRRPNSGVGGAPRRSTINEKSSLN